MNTPSRSSVGEALSVLLIDDDDFRTRGTMRFLKTNSVNSALECSAADGLARFAKLRPDVVVLNGTLVDGAGLDVCRQLRTQTDAPIIMISATAEEADRVIALESGADDYVTKPFSNPEMLARIRAHARRARGQVGPSARSVSVGWLTICSETVTATVRGVEIVLTSHEFIVLRALAERAGQVLTREQLLGMLGGKAFGRTVDVHVSRLRQKLGDDFRDPQILKTVRGVGYMLAPTLVADGETSAKTDAGAPLTKRLG